MSIIGSYIVIMLVCAGVVIAVSVFAYNRRLDKIARGEARDTHSAIPEPKDTVAGIYRVLLMGLVVMCLVNTGTANGLLMSMQNRINDLETRERETSYEVLRLREELAKNETLLTDVTWEVSNPDLEACTADVDVAVTLREFSKDTEVFLNINGEAVALAGSGAGGFHGKFTAELFKAYSGTSVSVVEGGVTRTEEVYDFPEYFFWDYLPMPAVAFNLTSSESFAKMKCEGSYTLNIDHKEEIESVTVTYMTGGKELASVDATKEALNGTEIELPKDLALEQDLTFRIDVAAKSGFAISQKMLVIFEERQAEKEDAEFLRIFGKDGELVWEDTAYSKFREAAEAAGDSGA